MLGQSLVLFFGLVGGGFVVWFLSVCSSVRSLRYLFVRSFVCLVCSIKGFRNLMIQGWLLFRFFYEFKVPNVTLSGESMIRCIEKYYDNFSC